MSKINREERKKFIDKKLGFWVTKKKQHAITDLLLDTPCTCPSNPDKCDRHWIIDHPDYEGGKIEKKMKKPIPIAKFLAAKYYNLEVLKYRESVCNLQPSGKFIIFSDLHQGAFAWSWDRKDFFWKNKEMYYHILKNYYYPKNYTLIEVGDIEEFWLKRWKRSFDDHWAFQRENYANLYDIRRKYMENNRYIRLRGNHDNLWAHEDLLKKYLWTDVQLDQLMVYEFAVIGNDFLIMHGHQVDSRNRDINCKKGRFWTKLGGILEFFTDTKFYGRKKPKKGWKTHPQAELIYKRKIANDIYNKTKLNISFAELANLLNIYIIIGHNHAPKCLPEGDLTFNSGCGVFEGILYGIEVNYDNDAIRVLDWNNDEGMPDEPKILCEKNISKLREKLTSS
ncbi:MAG: hypothetical protein ACFFD2_00215 [Promethearchaeota archaeon]